MKNLLFLLSTYLLSKYHFKFNLFRLGGVYPASFALRLAACRRSSLYGSRMETQRFGTDF